MGNKVVRNVMSKRGEKREGRGKGLELKGRWGKKGEGKDEVRERKKRNEE